MLCSARMRTTRRPRPLVLVILDGFGERAERDDNAVRLAKTPALDALVRAYPARAHRHERARRRPASGADGQQRGRPPELRRGPHRDDGHLAHRQRRRTTARSRQNPVIGDVDGQGEAARAGGSTSSASCRDGGVHSSLVHLFALIDAAKQGRRPGRRARLPRRARRPAGDRAAATSPRLETMLAGGTGVIGTVGGRYWAMDRDNRWERVEQRLPRHRERRGRARRDGAGRGSRRATPPARPTSSSSRSSSTATPACAAGDAGPALQLPPGPRARADARARRRRRSTASRAPTPRAPFEGRYACMTTYDSTLRPAHRVPEGDVSRTSSRRSSRGPG